MLVQGSVSPDLIRNMDLERCEDYAGNERASCRCAAALVSNGIDQDEASERCAF